MSGIKGMKHGAPIERLASRSHREGACWVWDGYLDRNGYGRFKADGRTTGTHTYAFDYFVGPVPEGLQLDHLCRTRASWNFLHLEPVTAAVNLHRSPLWIGNRHRQPLQVAA